jgi:hypothetical protein
MGGSRAAAFARKRDNGIVIEARAGDSHQQIVHVRKRGSPSTVTRMSPADVYCALHVSVGISAVAVAGPRTAALRLRSTSFRTWSHWTAGASLSAITPSSSACAVTGPRGFAHRDEFERSAVRPRRLHQPHLCTPLGSRPQYSLGRVRPSGRPSQGCSRLRTSPYRAADSPHALRLAPTHRVAQRHQPAAFDRETHDRLATG